MQVLSPITGRVIGAKEVRVGNDKVWLTKLVVQVVSGESDRGEIGHNRRGRFFILTPTFLIKQQCHCPQI